MGTNGISLPHYSTSLSLISFRRSSYCPRPSRASRRTNVRASGDQRDLVATLLHIALADPAKLFNSARTRHSPSSGIPSNTTLLLCSLSYHLPHLCDFLLICDIIPLRVVDRLRPSCPFLCTDNLAPQCATIIFSLRKSHALPALSISLASLSSSCKLHIRCN